MKRNSNKAMLVYMVITLMSINYSWSQDNHSIQRSSIGVHLIVDQFPQRDSIHLPGSADRSTIGLAISYLKGITPRLDFHTTLAISYPPFGHNSDRHALGEMDASLRGKLLPGDARIIPFLQTGAGLSAYNGHFGAFFPAGAGIQVNLPGETFLLFHAQYRITTAAWEPSHLYYSAGIAGVIGKKRNTSIKRRPPIPPTHPLLPSGSLTHSPLPSGNRDKDGDGIADSLDACPDIPGDASAHGCPMADTTHHVLLNDIREKLKTNAQNIFFEIDRYTLLPASFKALDETARLLKDNAQLHLLIEGHTDSTGLPVANQLLSQRRADAVRNYLIQQGIDEKRLFAKGYGSTKPIADNNTPQGRSRNRRVELIPQ